MSTHRHLVLQEVQAEMDRTDANDEAPTFEDYASDIVRRLNNLLPESSRFFEGDFPSDGAVTR